MPKRFLVYVKSSQRTPPTENIAHDIKINASSARESAPISFMPIFCNKSRNLVIVSMSNKIWQAKISAIKLNSNSTINPIVRLIQLIPVPNEYTGKESICREVVFEAIHDADNHPE